MVPCLVEGILRRRTDSVGYDIRLERDLQCKIKAVEISSSQPWHPGVLSSAVQGPVTLPEHTVPQ